MGVFVMLLKFISLLATPICLSALCTPLSAAAHRRMQEGKTILISYGHKIMKPIKYRLPSREDKRLGVFIMFLKFISILRNTYCLSALCIPLSAAADRRMQEGKIILTSYSHKIMQLINYRLPSRED